jgi:type IV secretory pathway VirB2 component (pilin)
LNRRIGWLVLILAAAISLTLVAAPVWIIQPFKAQSPQGLEWSYAMRRLATLVAPVAFILALALGIWLWRGSRWWRKGVLVLVLLATLSAAWFSRQNHFEWMFNPLPNAAYATVADASFVDPSDVVLSVVSNRDAVAYPIRQMAYHHLVHDVVDGKPVLATY